MNDTEFKIMNELIAKLEQANNMLQTFGTAPWDRYSEIYRNDFLRGSRSTIVKAREVREEATPL